MMKTKNGKLGPSIISRFFPHGSTGGFGLHFVAGRSPHSTLRVRTFYFKYVAVFNWLRKLAGPQYIREKVGIWSSEYILPAGTVAEATSNIS